MLKRSLIWLVILAGLTLPVQAAGTLPGFSLTPQFDQNGKPAPGCLLYTIQAGTTSTPQNAYQDSGLSILMPNPISCDASARLPQFFLADGLIKVRLTTSTGTQIFVQDNLLVIGPSSGGGGGGGSVDPTTVLQTGAVQAYYGTGTRSGYVRLNGRTIGSATSGATERANSDAQQLFEYLWNTDSTLTVSGGRGVSANADWLANKTLTLPDARGRVLAALDDMGNIAAGRLTSTYFGTSATVLGAANGGESVTMAIGNLIQHDHTVFMHDPGHKHQSIGSNSGVGWSVAGSTNTGVITNNNNTPNRDTTTEATGITLWSDGDNSGTQNKVGKTGSLTPTPLRTVQPTMLVTFYVKL